MKKIYEKMNENWKNIQLEIRIDQDKDYKEIKEFRKNKKNYQYGVLKIKNKNLQIQKLKLQEYLDKERKEINKLKNLINLLEKKMKAMEIDEFEETDSIYRIKELLEYGK